jgi:hypothetical protein
MIITLKKVLGWILIIFGLGVIFWDISISYYYFTAKKEFPQIFIQPKIEKTVTTSSGFDPQELAGNIIKEQMGQLMPENSISLLLNLSAWIMFATFLIYAGGKIVGMGNEFLKE